MFRPLLRKKQELPYERCIEILKKERRGVLSVIGDDGYPYGMPLNHYYEEEDGCLYFHGGKTGHKIDALKNCDKVSYCVIGEGVKEDWYYLVDSVIAFGKMSLVENEKTIEEKIRKLSRCFTDDEAYIDGEIASSLKGTLMLKMKIEHISGKHIKEK